MNLTSKPIALVLGARGRFGEAAVRAFAQSGWTVVAQARRGAPEDAPAGVAWLQDDVQDTAALAAAASGASVVVHALNPAYTGWTTQAMPLLDAAMRTAQALGARLMMPGNVYNFGAGMPAVVHEGTLQRAESRKGQVRIAMEQHLAQAARSGRVRSVVLRAGEFFGSGRGSWFDRALVKNIHRGRMTWPGAKDVRIAWAYVPDLAQAFVRVAERELNDAVLAPFDTLHFSGHSLGASDWLAQLSPVAHQERWIGDDEDIHCGTLPWRLIRLGASVVPMWRELVEMQYLWDTPHALSGERLARLIGAEPHTPLPLAACQALQALGKVGPRACPGLAWA